MTDALITPVVGGAAWAASAGLVGYSSRKLKKELDDRKVPLMGVMGAFVFAAQMVNFSIPATGSSGHLGGGLILAILLGPYAAFLTIASVLTVQALFFADGGLLALGCNILNLGFFPCFIGYPLIYRKMAGDHGQRWRISAGALAAAVVSLQFGSLAVVLQTVLSGVSELSFRTFLLLMQPVHLAIGLVEGFATAAVVLFVVRARPEILDEAMQPGAKGSLSPGRMSAVFLAAAVFLGGGLSWFASTQPDGLEWSLSRALRTQNPDPAGGEIQGSLSELQGKTAALPDYGFRVEEPQGSATGTEQRSGWSATKGGTPLSGLLGGFLTLLLAGGVGLILGRGPAVRRPKP